MKMYKIDKQKTSQDGSINRDGIEGNYTYINISLVSKIERCSNQVHIYLTNDDFFRMQFSTTDEADDEIFRIVQLIDSI